MIEQEGGQVLNLLISRAARFGQLQLLLLLAFLVALPATAGEPDAWRDWRVDGARVNRHLAELSRFGRNPQGGVSRVSFSPADVEGRQYAMGLMREAGLEVRIDPVGNVLGRWKGSVQDARPLVIGSHIDSVPEGGNYDGDVGSLSAIEVAQTLREKGYVPRHPLVVAIWCDEESGLTGSSGFVGNLPRERLTSLGSDGTTLADRIRRIGGDPDRLDQARHEKGSLAGYVELHIEQGATLDEAGVPIGIVLGIVGIHQYDVTFTGFANHAGTTPMDRRKNALLAASELVLAVDRIVRSVPGRQVGTVGRLSVRPGAPNVIPGEVKMTVELRDLDMEKIESLWKTIRAEAEAIAARREVTFAFTVEPPAVAALTDPHFREVIAESAEGLGLPTRPLPSGAGHDAQELARITPMGMIFVPSVGGISHSPEELTRPEEVTNGANVLLQTLLRLDR
jgi:N-carbamoyl-L-amino-acid hydrolase